MGKPENLNEQTKKIVPPQGIAEEVLRVATLSPNLVVFATDAQGILTYTDGLGLACFDAKPGDGVGQYIADFFGYTPPAHASVLKVLEGKSLYAVTPFRGRYFERRLVPTYGSGGNITGLVGVSGDVTEIQQTEEERDTQKELIQDLFASISDGVFIIDHEYTILQMNPAMEKMYAEYMPLLGKKCYVTAHCDNICPNCPTEKMFELKKQVTLEHYKQSDTDKPGMWLAHTAHPLFERKTGNISGAIIVIRDITVRKQNELELRKYQTELEELVDHRTHDLQLSEAKLRSILETSSAPISFIDWQGNITYVNQAYRTLFGYSESELYGKPALAFTADTNEVYQDFWDIVQGKIDFKSLTTRFIAKDGRIVWVDINASVVQNDDPKETLVVSIFTDVTARQQILEELQQTKTAAEEASQAKSLFLAMMNHELRTPLNGIIGLSEVLLNMNLPPKQLEYAKLIKASGHSLLILINDILDFSNIESGQFGLKSTEFSLHEMVESVIGTLMPRANEQNLELTVTFSTNVPRLVSGDQGRIRQVLLSLLDNGLKFTKTGSVQVCVSNESIQKNGVTIRFTVIDTGIGIPKERFPHIFQSFFQIDSSTSRIYGGIGIGLSISKKLVELMGGTIGVNSDVGKGTTFWFCIPLKCSPEILETVRH